MSFTYSAIGDNTKENREHLEKLGYDDNRVLFLKKNEYDFIISVFFEDNTCSYMQVDEEELQTWIDSNKYVGIETIDCRNNDPLFQDVTALRDDNDYMQWFTGGKVWQKSLADEAGLEIWKKLYKTVPWKATLSELQERFKAVTVEQ